MIPDLPDLLNPRQPQGIAVLPARSGKLDLSE